MLQYIKEQFPYLSQGDMARLMPIADGRRTGSKSGKEGRITSCTLASLMSVNEFALALLNSIDAPCRKTSKIECLTEVEFERKDKSKPKGDRPDGLIVVTTGKTKWRALVEVKVDKNKIESEQVEKYIDLAKEHKIDAVITISNQFVASPKYSPADINKQKTRGSVSLYHWSWTYIMTQALLCVECKDGVKNPDQAYILGELVRYLKSDTSGVLSFTRMNESWRDLCDSVREGLPLRKNDIKLRESVVSWHEYMRNLSLDLSLAVGESINVHFSRTQLGDIEKRISDDIESLITNNFLQAEFNIPQAAGRLRLVADLKTRLVVVSMRIKAPTDRSFKQQINWLVKKDIATKTKNTELIRITADWGHGRTTYARLSELLEKDYSRLENNTKSLKVREFEISLSKDLSTNKKFRGQETFVKESNDILTDFYEDIGQYLDTWKPSAPKVKPNHSSNATDAEEKKETTAAGVIPSTPLSWLKRI